MSEAVNLDEMRRHYDDEVRKAEKRQAKGNGSVHPAELPPGVGRFNPDGSPRDSGDRSTADPLPRDEEGDGEEDDGDAEAARKAEEQKRKAEADARAKLPPMPVTYTEAWLAKQTIAPAVFLVADLLPIGAYVFSAPPKIGKTWLVMSLCRAVVTGGLFGGRLPCTKGKVLHLDLEGNKRRGKKRQAILRDGELASDDYAIAHEWPRMGAGGLELLEVKILQEKLKLVVVDVWACFRAMRPKNADPYQHDHDNAKLVAELAERTGCVIILVHHNRKSEADDFVNEASGSTGLPGGVDGSLSLKRGRGETDAVLKAVGRDLEEAVELAMSFKGGVWSILGDAAEVMMGKTRQAIHSALCFAGKPMKPAEVAERTDLKRELVKKTLQRMLAAGTVKVDANGGYRPAETGTA